MAFYTHSTFASSLPSGYDAALVDRILRKVEVELTRLGFVFADPAESSFSLDSDHSYRTVFGITPTRSITSILLKQRDSDSSTTLVANQDYHLIAHNNLAGYTIQIKAMGQHVVFPEYLEVTGKRGIYIDTESPSVLQDVLTDFLIAQLEIRAGASVLNKAIKTAKTGESSVSYADTSRKDISYSFASDPEFQTVFDYYLC